MPFRQSERKIILIFITLGISIPFRGKAYYIFEIESYSTVQLRINSKYVSDTLPISLYAAAAMGIIMYVWLVTLFL